MAEAPTIGFLLKQLHDRMKQMMDAELQPFGLTMTQAKFLGFLRSREGQPTTQKDLEIHFGIAHPTVIGVLKRLKQKGLVTTMPDPEDKRRKLVLLAPAEEEIYAHVRTGRQHIEDRLTKDLSVAQQQDLKDILARLLRALEQ